LLRPRHAARHVRSRPAQHCALGRYRNAAPEAIARRLEELDHEWDIERAIEANAAGIALAGVALGAFVDRRFLLLPAAVCLFLMQHALQGWCPPVPILRRLGFRTAREIFEERLALKSLLDRAS
jgi:hypothetical protein